MKKVVELKYGKGKLKFEIPEENLLGIVKPKELPGVPDEKAEIKRALENPINSKRLSELIEPSDKVCIIASDITRPAPSHVMLLPLLEELRDGGMRDENITLVFALGIHRKHTVEEQKKLVGEEVFNRVKCIDHDAKECVPLGKTSRGTEVKVFRAVLDADVRICTGNLEYHYFAGYSGGLKAIMPGVCSRETVEQNHSMMILPDAVAGKLEGNPVREDMNEVGRMVGVDFILNVVLNSKKEIVRAVAGDAIAAHREGVKYIDEMYRVKIPERADIVITSPGGFPKDINLYQAQKAFDNAKYAVNEGGVIILPAECPEGLGETTFESWMKEAKTPDEIIDKIRKKFVLGGHKAAAIAMILKKVDGYLISSMPKEEVEAIFFKPMDSIDEALRIAMKKLGKDANVLILPYGGSTLPSAEN